VTLNNMTLTDIFCSAQVILPQSGEIFIAGGDNWTGTGTTNTGNNNSNLFDYSDNTLVRSMNMFRARWYASTTVMIDGEVYIQGGNGGGDRPEVRQLNGAFRLLGNANTSSYAAVFPRNFLAPDGRVFGYDTSGKMYFVNHNGTGSLSPAGQISSANAGWTSSAAMYRPGKILQIGGNSNGAAIIDINGPQPAITITQSMSSRRQWVSATVLANGKVIGTGGSQTDNQLTGVNNSAEIWDPATGSWFVGPSAVRARLYHSAALLLPDASVLVSGGGAPGPQVNTNAEIYYPPYLFAGNSFAVRPQIRSAPDSVEVGDVLDIETDITDVSAVNIVKTGSVTHSVNMDQRFLTLPFVQSGNMVQASLPARATDLPPGYYLMFLLDAQGVPSMASMLRVNIDATPFVAVDYTPSIGGGGGTPFTLACPSDEILVGVHGRYATYVNQIGPRCVKVDQLGRWIGNPVDGLVTGTTTSGTAFSKSCPRDHAASGFRGRSDQYVNQIEIQCRALTGSGGLTGATAYLGGDGGTGGTAQAPLACGTGNPVYALYGRSAGWLDSFGVQCRQAVITPVSVNSSPVIANPGTRTGSVGIALSLQIAATDGDGDTLTYQAANRPPGLAINASTGLVSGTPTAAGSYSSAVTVSDGMGSDVANFTWNIGVAPPLTVAPMPPQPATAVNNPVNYTAAAEGGVDVLYKWDFGDGSPATAFSPDNTVTHTFVAPGIYYVILTVTDASGTPLIQTFVQRVHLPLTAGAPQSSSNIVYEVTAANDRVWVVNQDGNSVTVINAVTHTKLAEIVVGAAPRSVAVARDGRVWVTNKGSSSISVIEPSTMAVNQTIAMPRGSAPYGIVFSPSASEAFVVLEAAGQVVKIDTITGAKLLSAETGPAPRHIAIDASGSKVYISRFVSARQPGEDTAQVSSAVAGVPQGGEVTVLATSDLSSVDRVVLQHSSKADAENQGSGVPNYLGAPAISPDGTSAWVPSKLDNIQRGALRNGFNLNFQNTVRAVGSRIVGDYHYLSSLP
jgi:YVTN family beta-propeller protein